MKNEVIITPKADEVPKLTDRLVEIDVEISKLTVEKKSIQARLEAYSLTQQQEPLKDATREGRKFTLPGIRHRLPVLFTSDLIIGTFKDDSAKHHELRSIVMQTPTPLTDEAMKAADEKLKLFFDAPRTWENRYDDGKKFRAAVAEELPANVATKFISACTQKDKHGVKKSNTVFDYKAASKVEGKEPS